MSVVCNLYNGLFFDAHTRLNQATLFIYTYNKVYIYILVDMYSIGLMANLGLKRQSEVSRSPFWMLARSMAVLIDAKLDPHK